MKRPFSKCRPDTITRANIDIARTLDPSLDTPEKVAEHFCGLGRPSAHQFAKARHVLRAERLMK